jgi:hypothetical protein
LRHTNNRTVTVWVAMRLGCAVTLNVHTATAQSSGSITIGSAPVLTSAATPTIQLGQNLHLVTVSATLPESQSLSVGQIYCYDLKISNCSDSTFNDLNLKSPKLVADKSITYGNYPLPAFTPPPENLSELRIVHGSCRKPHGESGDAMQAVDTMLSKATGYTSRPHQLYLTGDQIYADDVADALLYMLIDAGAALLGTPEPLPLVDKDKEKQLRPGLRFQLGREVAHLSNETDYGKSHLFRLSEFFCMYLCAWSDVLWPAELPTFEEVYPAADFDEQGQHKYMFGVDDTLFYSLDGTKTVEPTRYDKDMLKKRFDRERERVTTYRNTLKQVRRALANVPTYMIFDDHEVTDDWYLTKGWCASIFASDLGRRIIQNGLLAYAVFQAWGNTPERFTGSAGKNGQSLLKAAADWTKSFYVPNYDANAAGAALSAIAKHVGVTDANFTGGELAHTADTLDWHFQVTGPKFQVIVLDTRTYRCFPGNEWDRCALLSDAGLAAQLGGVAVAPKTELTLVIAPTNVISLAMTELATDYACGEDLGDEPGAKTAGVDRGDPWTAQTAAFEALLAKLVARVAADGSRRFVLLGGDIHYGYAARMQYWATRPYKADPPSESPPKEIIAVFAHFTSSALKHESFKTRLYHRFAYFPAQYMPLPFKWGGWNTRPNVNEADIANRLAAKDDLLSINKLWHLREEPPMLYLTTLPAESVVNPYPDWRYRIDFIPGKATERGFPPANTTAAAPPASAADWLKQAVNASKLYADYANRAAGTDIVGVNNIGVITFKWGTGEDKTATQTLWWRLGSADAPQALTSYTVGLSTSDSKYEKPKLPKEA